MLTIPRPAAARLAADLAALGLDEATVHANLAPAELYEHALARGEGLLGADGQLVVETGEHTGRSPKDKFFVREASSEGAIDWGETNRPFEAARFDALFERVAAYLRGRELYALDAYVGADPRYRLPVRVVAQYAWHALFARNLLILPSDNGAACPPFPPGPPLGGSSSLRSSLEDGAACPPFPPGPPLGGPSHDFEPEFTVIDVPEFFAEPARDGTRSGTFVLVHFGRRLILIGGTRYAGEIKKSIFTVMNFLMPLRSVLPMHCSANVGAAGDVAIFFGLSGTGKTTLSADPRRRLVGDDEHGWSGDGIFNFEGGCYAKVIRLSAAAEPAIWAATHRFGTVLENVPFLPQSHTLDLESERKTENTRAAYPISFIPNVVPGLLAGHPRAIVMLTADAFGVLPPIARLSSAQARYHFLSGYTAKVAGTERGVREPTATFSTCFGAPFMVQHPTVYAKMLGARIALHGASCWLVNTGWTGGPYGVGKRMPLEATRAMIEAALDGRLAGATYRREARFGLEVPTAVPGVPAELLDPRATWPDPAAYDAQAARLAGLFAQNFAAYEALADPEVRAVAIRP
ncbi:MAG: phosphoenolpyruvate carboxykinase (ATP) [Vulcanimicrobiaceae bacterium]